MIAAAPGVCSDTGRLGPLNLKVRDNCQAMLEHVAVPTGATAINEDLGICSGGMSRLRNHL